MNYSDIKKYEWFELLQLDYNPYDYERYLYNTDIRFTNKKNGLGGSLYLQIHKNSNDADYVFSTTILGDNFWISQDEKTIDYKQPPGGTVDTNRKFIKIIFEKGIN